MDYNILQILLIFLITFIAAIDQFSFLESTDRYWYGCRFDSG